MVDRLSAWEGDVMESWRDTWRRGFAPVLPLAGLVALREALVKDDGALTQGSTTVPPPLMCVDDWPVEAACAVGFCGWHAEELATVGQVKNFFGMACHDADERLGEPAGCRHFLNWFDDTPRHECFAALLPEVELAIAAREGVS